MSNDTKVKYSEFPHVSHDHMDLLMKCYSICSSCAKKCIQENMQDTAILCSDCADICALAIKLHSSDSEFNEQVIALCSEVCKRCGDACAKHSAKHCQQCSDICHKCSEACKNS